MHRYVDDPVLRQAIEMQPGKIELTSRFTRAAAVGIRREFTRTEKKDQEASEACNQLIRNSIICWNHLCLAWQLQRSPDSGAADNLLGEHYLPDEKLRDALGIFLLKPAA